MSVRNFCLCRPPTLLEEKLAIEVDKKTAGVTDIYSLKSENQSLKRKVEEFERERQSLIEERAKVGQSVHAAESEAMSLRT